MSDDKLIALARHIVAAVRGAEVNSEERDTVFGIARELLYLDQRRRWHEEARSLGEVK